MFEKINMHKARKLWNSHKPIVMCASNLRPELFGVEMDKTSITDSESGFDYVVNAFHYYNCINSDRPGAWPSMLK